MKKKKGVHALKNIIKTTDLHSLSLSPIRYKFEYALKISESRDLINTVKIMETIQLKARNTHQKEFAKTLKTNVRRYFRENGLSTKGDYRMIIKAIIMISLYVIPFVIILSIGIPAWFALVMSIIMGLGIAGIGMGVMHDAVHGTFSRHEWLNKLMGWTMFLLGSNVVNWKIQHNILHHSFTNIFDWDEDINNRPGIRLSRYGRIGKINRYQHIYSFFLYGLMTVSKLYSDFGDLQKFHKKGILSAMNIEYNKTFFLLIISKTLYIGVILGLPLISTDFLWWQILVGFFVMHYVASIFMSVVFQLAHVIDDVEQPLPDENGIIHDENFVHQLKTTSNFAGKNPLLSWFIGGLDYQVEHHLFPNICHIYYKNIAPIVENTAKEYGIPYHSKKSFFSALLSHIKMLKMLGRGYDDANNFQVDRIQVNQ